MSFLPHTLPYISISFDFWSLPKQLPIYSAFTGPLPADIAAMKIFFPVNTFAAFVHSLLHLHCFSSQASLSPPSHP